MPREIPNVSLLLKLPQIMANKVGQTCLISFGTTTDLDEIKL